MTVEKVMLLSDGHFTIDMGMLVYGKMAYYGQKYRAALKPLYIETEDDRILIDTGIGPADTKPAQFMKAEKDPALEDSLHAQDLHPDDITMVINTHLHMDHCGWNRMFKCAKFYVQREEWNYAQNPHRFQQAAYFQDYFKGLEFEFLEGSTTVVPGVSVVATPGHTPGHQSVVVETKDRRTYIYCGDVAPIPENIDRRKIVGVLHDPVQALESIDRLRDMEGKLIYSHDKDQMTLS
jgi:N-acyl homoserine lactone hydrolase